MDSKSKIRLIIRESIREQMLEASIAQQVMSLFSDPNKSQYESEILEIISSSRKGQKLVSSFNGHSDALIKIRLNSLLGIFKHCEKIAETLADDEYSGSFIEEIAHSIESHADRFVVLIKNIKSTLPEAAKQFQKYWDSIYTRFQEFYQSKH